METVLYSFCVQGGSKCTDRAIPLAGVVFELAENVYGTTYRAHVACRVPGLTEAH